MEPRNVTLSPSNHLHDFHGNHARRCSDGRSTAGWSSGPSPMAIQVPNRRVPEAPPPLPPPRYVNDPDPHRGSGRSYGHASRGERSEESRGSATAGLSFPKSWGARMEAGNHQEVPGFRRRDVSTTSSISNARSPTDSERRYEAIKLQDEGYYSLSGPSPMYQQSVLTLHCYHQPLLSPKFNYDSGPVWLGENT